MAAALKPQLSREDSYCATPQLSRENSFTAIVDSRRLSELGLTTSTFLERREVTWLEDVLNYLWPDKSIEDINNPRFWKDLFFEFVCCAYFICLVNWVLVSNFEVSGLG